MDTRLSRSMYAACLVVLLLSGTSGSGCDNGSTQMSDASNEGDTASSTEDAASSRMDSGGDGAPSCEEACEDNGCSNLSESTCLDGCTQNNWDACQRNCISSASTCSETNACKSMCSTTSNDDAGMDTGGGDDSGTINPDRNCPGRYEDSCPTSCENRIASSGDRNYCAYSCNDNGNCPLAAGLECYQGNCRHPCDTASDCPDRPYDFTCQNLAGGDQKFCNPRNY